MPTYVMAPHELAREQQMFITKVYGWMFTALVITAMVAMFTASSPQLLNVILGNQMVFFALIILELVAVGALAGWVRKMSVMTAMAIFIGYSVLNGLTLSVIFIAFTSGSIASTFFVTAATFGIMSVYGYVTKSDLTGAGNLFFMGLVGVILASVVNIFLKSSALYWITTYAGIAIFVGLTAYDTQKIKNMNIIGNEGTDEGKKEAITGALTLYLDFINLFLMLLRIFGKRR